MPKSPTDEQRALARKARELAALEGKDLAKLPQSERTLFKKRARSAIAADKRRKEQI